MAERGKPADRIAEFEEARAQGAREIAERPERVLELITHRQAVFTRRDVAREINRYVDDGEAFQAILTRVMASPELRQLAPEQGKQPARYSTRAMIQAERDMMAEAQRLARARTHGVSPEHTDAALGAFPKLSGEQKAAVRHVAGPGRIAAVAGAAGTGKSTMLAAAKAAWERQGLRVRGAALAGKAADGLREGSQIESRTIASLEWAWAQGKDRLAPRDVLVIDEAGMIGSRQLGRVLAEARKAGAKVVLVGDGKQLQPIEAGAPFRAIAERTGFAEIATIRRQREQWAREASMDFAKGHVRDGLSAYRERGHVRFEASREEAKAAIARDWMAGRKDGKDTIVLAHTRTDVRDLNEAIRRARAAAGELGEAAAFQTGQGKREFAAGDRVVFLKNDRELGVKNGTLGRVEEAAAGRLGVVLDNGERRTVEAHAYAAVDHGYAVTIHKAQGATVDRAFRAGERRHGPAFDLCRHDAPPRAGDALCGRRRFRELRGDGLAPGAQADQRNHARFRGAARHRHLRDWIENGRALLNRTQARFERAIDHVGERLGLEGKTWRQELQERRQQTAAPDARESQAEIEAAAARTEAARAAASPEVAWKAAMAAKFQGVRSKAERSLAEIEKRKAAMTQKLAEIERAGPAAPRGLSALIPSAKARDEERHSEWMGQRDMLLKALRRADERAKTVREFTRRGHCRLSGPGREAGGAEGGSAAPSTCPSHAGRAGEAKETTRGG